MELPSIKFHENPSSGGLGVPCRQTYMTNVIVAFGNFHPAPKIPYRRYCSVPVSFRTLFLGLLVIWVDLLTFHVVWTTSAKFGLRAGNMQLNNLMFFWPCIMNWLYINYQLDAPIIIYS